MFLSNVPSDPRDLTSTITGSLLIELSETFKLFVFKSEILEPVLLSIKYFVDISYFTKSADKILSEKADST